MCFYNIFDLDTSDIPNSFIVEDETPLTLETYEELPPSPEFFDSVEEEEVPEEEPLPWECQAGSDFIFYLQNLFASPDYQIIDFYKNHYPDMAVPIVNKGLEFNYFKKALDYCDEIPILFRPDVPIHLKGKFFMKENDNVLRYCTDCVDFYEPDDLYGFYIYHRADNDSSPLEIELSNPYTSYKYWCNCCDRFLFEVEDWDEICCDTCNDIIGYSDNGQKLDLTDAIDLYYRID
nr:NS3 [Mute swan feces associated ambidensovirus 2]